MWTSSNRSSLLKDNMFSTVMATRCIQILFVITATAFTISTTTATTTTTLQHHQQQQLQYQQQQQQQQQQQAIHSKHEYYRRRVKGEPHRRYQQQQQQRQQQRRRRQEEEGANITHTEEEMEDTLTLLQVLESVWKQTVSVEETTIETSCIKADGTISEGGFTTSKKMKKTAAAEGGTIVASEKGSLSEKGEGEEEAAVVDEGTTTTTIVEVVTTPGNTVTVTVGADGSDPSVTTTTSTAETSTNSTNRLLLRQQQQQHQQPLNVNRRIESNDTEIENFVGSLIGDKPTMAPTANPNPTTTTEESPPPQFDIVQMEDGADVPTTSTTTSAPVPVAVVVFATVPVAVPVSSNFVVSTPFTATPLAAPITVSPLTSPFTVAPLAAPITLAPLSSSSSNNNAVGENTPISTLAPAVSMPIASENGGDGTTSGENGGAVKSVKAPKTTGTTTGESGLVKDTKKKGKKLPFCEEMGEGGFMTPSKKGKKATTTTTGTGEGGLTPVKGSKKSTTGGGSTSTGDEGVDTTGGAEGGTGGSEGGTGGSEGGTGGSEGGTGGSEGGTGGSEGEGTTGEGGSSNGGGEGSNGGSSGSGSGENGEDGTTKPDSESDIEGTTSTAVPSDMVSSTVTQSKLPPTFVGQEAVCTTFLQGDETIPTGATVATYEIDLSILVDTVTTGVTTEEIVNKMYTILNEEVAPAVLGCTSVSRRLRRLSVQQQRQQQQRRLEEATDEPVTELVHIEFDEPTADSTDGSCTRTDAIDCVAIKIISRVAYFGDEPVGFAEVLQRALLFWNWEDIIGWKGFNEVLLTLVSTTSADEGTGGEAGDTSTNGANTDTTDREPGDEPVVSAANKSGNNDDSVNPGAFVAAGVAALTLMLIALFVVKRRHRNRMEYLLGSGRDGDNMKHIQMTDDEEDELVTHNVTHDRNKSYVASDADNYQPNTHRNNSIDDEEDDIERLGAVASITSRTGNTNRSVIGSTEVEALDQNTMDRPYYGDSGNYDNRGDVGDSSLDASSFYKRYPERHLITHRISSYDSEFKRVNEVNNHRSYNSPSDTVEL